MGMLTPLNFEFEEKQVRFVGTADKPEWIAQDVCDVLEIVNVSQALKDFRTSEKGVCIIYTLGGSQETLTVTEPGLYRLIFKSRKPVAERFRCWIFDEVLPTIRKTGSYSLTQDVYGHADLAVIMRPVYEPIATSLVTLTDNVTTLAESVRIHAQNIDNEIKTLGSKVVSIEDRVRRIEENTSKGRRDFKPVTKAIFMRVIWQHFRGCFPVSGVQIMDGEYSIIRVNGRPVAEYDHWNGKHNNQHLNGWLIDSVVHAKVTASPELRGTPEFEIPWKAFQLHLRQMLEAEQGIQQSLPV